MARLRSLLWLIALAAFVLPPFGGSLGGAVAAHAGAVAERAVAEDCPGHAPPPDCPAQGTAKHAAGTCCPLMASVVALLVPTAAALAPSPPRGRVKTGMPRLSGLSSSQDPPPPRV